MSEAPTCPLHGVMEKIHREGEVTAYRCVKCGRTVRMRGRGERVVGRIYRGKVTG